MKNARQGNKEGWSGRGQVERERLLWGDARRRMQGMGAEVRSAPLGVSVEQ